MRKVEIEARRVELDKQIRSGRAKPFQQADERQRLMVACQMAGDHVPSYNLIIRNGQSKYIKVCQFCGMQMGSDQEQIAQNLTIG